MKKYLFSFIPFKPIFFILLSLSILPPELIFAGIVNEDTVYYFNERGRLLWCNVHAAQPASYVIKTKKAYSQIFQEIPPDDSTVQVSAGYNTAAVLNIERSVARRVAWLIRQGKIDDPLVLENIVPVLNKRIIRRMYDNIISRCTGSDAHLNKEHGGVVLPDGTVTCISGDLSDPRWLLGATLLIRQKALVYYHSHPDGAIEQTNTGDWSNTHNPNRISYIQTSETRTISYVQGPSRQDQESVGEGIGYVFGIKAGGGLIYIYDKDGVKATLPISFVKKAGKTSNKRVKKTDTYFAGLLPVVELPHLF